jgi:hypothetical protein
MNFFRKKFSFLFARKERRLRMAERETERVCVKGNEVRGAKGRGGGVKIEEERAREKEREKLRGGRRPPAKC